MRLIWLAMLCCATVSAETVAKIETGGGPAPDLVDYSVGFGVNDSGSLFWWQGYSTVPSAELPARAEIGRKGIASAENKEQFALKEYGFTIGGVDRDRDTLFIAANQNLYRRYFWAPPEAPLETMPGTEPYLPLGEGRHLGAVYCYDDSVFWSSYRQDGSGFAVFATAEDGSGTDLAAIGNTGGRVQKLAVHSSLSLTGNAPIHLFVLTSIGDLFEFTLGYPFAGKLLSSGVTDFVLRDESVTFGTFSKPSTKVYVALGRRYNLELNSAPGAIVSIDADSGASVPVLTAPAPRQVTSLAVDDSNLYWTEQPVIQTWPLKPMLGAYEIHRKARPSDGHATSGLADGLIGFGPESSGTLLVARGSYLYCLNDSKINRLKTDTSVLPLELKAEGLEVTQILQSLDSHIGVIANRPAFVRGYARLSKNYTGNSVWYPNAELHGWMDGHEFGETIWASARINPTSEVTLGTLRSSLDGTFLFALPDSWTAASDGKVHELSFRMDLNKDQKIPVSDNPLSTNYTVGLIKNAHLVPGVQPTLQMVPVLTTGTLFTHQSPKFGNMMGRLFSMLPSESSDSSETHLVLSTNLVSDDGDPWDLTNQDREVQTEVWDDIQNTMTDLGRIDSSTSQVDYHTIGMIHPNAINFLGGIAGISRRYTPGVVAAMITPEFGGDVMAHELGHSYGQRHIACGIFPPDQTDFDFSLFPCSLGQTNYESAATHFGFDSLHMKVIPPDAASDVMSYSLPSWPSPTYLSGLFVRQFDIKPPQDGWQGGQFLWVRGLLPAAADGVKLKTFYVFPGTDVPEASIIQSFLDSGEADIHAPRLRFLDAKRTVLSETPLLVKERETHLDFASTNKGSFSSFIRLPSGAESVEITLDGMVVAERTLRHGHIRLSVGSVSDLDGMPGWLGLKWQCETTPSLLCHFLVKYSSDDGATWQTLVLDTTRTEIRIDRKTLTGSTHGRIRVWATDGINTVSADSNPFAVGDSPPVVFFSGIGDGDRLAFGDPKWISAIPASTAPGVISQPFHLTLHGPTSFTTGSHRIPVGNLPPGYYSLTAHSRVVGANSDALGVIRFSIGPTEIPTFTGELPLIDGSESDAAYAGAVSLAPADNAANGPAPTLRMIHAGAALYVSVSGMVRNSPMVLRIDSTQPGDGSNGKISSRTVAITVSSDGSTLVENGGVGSYLPVLSPDRYFRSSVAWYGSNFWSAELLVPENMLGGWNMVVRGGVDFGIGTWPGGLVSTDVRTFAELHFGSNLKVQSINSPVANAGSDLYLAPGKARRIVLDGSGSFDPQGGIVAYSWRQASGPAVLLEGSSGANPSFVCGPFEATTAMEFDLTVSVGGLESERSRVKVVCGPPLSTVFLQADRVTGFELTPRGQLWFRIGGGRPFSRLSIEGSDDLKGWVSEAVRYADKSGFIEASVPTVNAGGANHPARFYRLRQY